MPTLAEVNEAVPYNRPFVHLYHSAMLNRLEWWKWATIEMVQILRAV